MKPYYEQDGITIYHGDCIDILPYLQADVAITDPPYNAGVEYLTYDDSRTVEDYSAWCAEWFGLLRPNVKGVALFPGIQNLHMWWHISKPSGHGCWYKPGSMRNLNLGWNEWEPWLWWGGRLGGSDTCRVSTVDNLSIDTGVHPCPKPLSLFRWLIEKTKATSIIDPFMGSGTTLRAAKDLGRKAIGIEIEERYCEIAANRLAQGVLSFGDL